LAFSGTGVEEVGVVASNTNPDIPLTVGTKVVEVDPRYFRPTEVELLIGDPKKANDKLNWIPKYDLEALVSEMVRSDLEVFKKEQILKDAGYNIKGDLD